jgi:AcrR family transcriptional regulator
MSQKRTLPTSKSKRTRNAILDATLECLAQRPYPEVTMAAVSAQSGISKGGIQYHFPSRHKLLHAAVNHLFEQRLEAYRDDINNAPHGIAITDHIIDNHWEHLTAPEFQIYQQLVLAGRSNPELHQLLTNHYREFISEWRSLSLASFGWDYTDPKLNEVGNVARCLLDGMAYGWFADQLRDDEVGPLLDFVKNLMREGAENARRIDSPPKSGAK